jgi:hypothetical protein
MPDQDEKDRLGDLLEKKKRGDEDRYFAEQDRLRIEKLRARTAATREGGTCPRCGRPLAGVGRRAATGECDGGCART